jgi:hypothetical protein
VDADAAARVLKGVPIFGALTDAERKEARRTYDRVALHATRSSSIAMTG